MLKKLTSIASAALLLTGVALADSQSFVIAPNTQTNLLPAPMKLLSLTIIATNAATFTVYDAPGNTTTNIVGAYSNLVQYATNVGLIYTNFFGVTTTNWLTNALVFQTNSVPAKTNNYATVLTYAALSNSTARLPNLNMSFVNGILVTNNSGNTITLTPEYSGQ